MGLTPTSSTGNPKKNTWPSFLRKNQASPRTTAKTTKTKKYKDDREVYEKKQHGLKKEEMNLQKKALVGGCWGKKVFVMRAHTQREIKTFIGRRACVCGPGSQVSFSNK